MDFESMRVSELKDELRNFGAPVSGTKGELIERLNLLTKKEENIITLEDDDLLGIEGGRKEGGSIIDNNILRRRLRAARRRHMKAWKAANPGSTKQEREDERRKFTRDFVIKDVIGGVALYYGLRSPGGGGGGPSKPGGGGGGSAP